MERIIEQLKNIPELTVLEHEPLSSYTGFRTGGPSTVLEPHSPAAFAAAADLLEEHGAPYRILGNGTNLIAKQEGYDGFVLRTQKAFEEVSVEGSTVTAGAGIGLTAVCRAALTASLTGLEFAYGIPGSVGGAVYMNAGAYGGEMKDVVSSVTAYDTKSRSFITVPAEELALGYRTSIFHEDRTLLVTGASFALEPGDPAAIEAAMKDLMGRRRDKQPLEYPSCGSTFKRPQGAFAGKLIEDCGLKGYTCGGACVSEKHAGFVINKGGATSDDVFAVIRHVRETVLRKTGYDLQCEVEVLE